MQPSKREASETTKLRKVRKLQAAVGIRPGKGKGNEANQDKPLSRSGRVQLLALNLRGRSDRLGKLGFCLLGETQSQKPNQSEKSGKSTQGQPGKGNIVEETKQESRKQKANGTGK
jgi:hypothetical protein